MTPEQLHILRFQLPPLGEGALPSEEFKAYSRFYGIDFTDRVPGLLHLAGHVPSGDYRLAVQQWRQPAAVANLLVVHGYFDHIGLFGKLLQWGLDNRCNVVALDLPGHGLSTGEPAVIDDFGDYSCAIRDVLQRVRMPDLPLFVMAQSMGCASLIDFAGRYEWPFAAAVLLAPLVRPSGWRGIRLAQALIAPFVDSVPRSFPRNSADEEFLAFVRADPLQCHTVPLRWIRALRRWLQALQHADLKVGPALIVQGDDDGTVDWRYNVPVVEKLFPDSRVHYLAGAGHQLANESAAYRDDYLAVVRDYLAGRGISLRTPDQL